jgi:uracil-DNA glycosylase
MDKITNWDEVTTEVILKPEMQSLKKYIAERRTKANVIPEGAEVFNVFKKTPYETVRVVILQQDPYHRAGHSHGFAYSSKRDDERPPVLENIFKEIYTSLEIEKKEGISFEDYFPTNNLSNWSKQGVLLLNTVLTVEEGIDNSHVGKGWELLAEVVFKALNEKESKIYFMLWGSAARVYKKYITNPLHEVLEGPDPSPLSASTGFFGCNHFKKVTDALLFGSEDVYKLDLRSFFKKEEANTFIYNEAVKKGGFTERNKKLVEKHLENLEWSLNIMFGNTINWSTNPNLKLKNE